MQTEHTITWKGLTEQKQDDMHKQHTLNNQLKYKIGYNDLYKPGHLSQ